MNKIRVLDQNTIDKIAAGEVVERPASVAKELIENAIDAGSSAVTVEIKNGGVDFLRITDNGCGIAGDQIREAFLRHATSKLRSISDLSTISSLGFRGEALSSISAVSQVELITRDAQSITGVRYVIHGGVERSYEEIGAPYGTTFIMRNLFFNTPARAKFLKSATSEQNAVTAYVEQLALSHPEISFNYIVNGTSRLYTPGNGSLREVVYRIYGKNAVHQLFEVDAQSEHVKMTGFLGRAEASRGNRSFEIYFINGRYVRDKILSKAIEEGYQGNLMQHRYPFTVLNFNIDSTKVDVNVHPAKLEVRFSAQQEIYNEIVEAVREAVLENQSVPSVVFEKKEEKKADKILRVQTEAVFKEPKENEADKPEIVEKTEPPLKNRQKVHIPEPFENVRREGLKRVPELVAEKQVTFFENDKITPEKTKTHRIIGQVFDTYMLVENDDRLYLIDQHAAHEKIIYERLIKGMRKRSALSQQLMPSRVLSLSVREADALKGNINIFADFGFEIEEFGGNGFRITAVPSDLYAIDTDELFKEILDGLVDPNSSESKIIEERIALRSCKEAIMANMRMSYMETASLIDELFALDDPYHCPHGRPVVISFSHYELDRKFKRIV